MSGPDDDDLHRAVQRAQDRKAGRHAVSFRGQLLLIGSLGVTILVPVGPHYYVVQKGDELRDVAALYGTTVLALQELNNLPNPDLIYVDQELLIPVRYNAAPLPFTP